MKIFNNLFSLFQKKTFDEVSVSNTHADASSLTLSQAPIETYESIFNYKSVILKINGTEYDIMSVTDVNQIPCLPSVAYIFGEQYAIDHVLIDNAKYLRLNGGNHDLINVCIQKAIELFVAFRMPPNKRLYQNPQDLDSLLFDAGKFVIKNDKASIGLLQLSFKIGFNRAVRLMNQLELFGVVSEEDGTKPRNVLMAMTDFLFLEEHCAEIIAFCSKKDPSVNTVPSVKVEYFSHSLPPKESLDSLLVDAAKFIIEKDKASIGMVQRVFKIGFNRAARIMDQLAELGVVGEEEGTNPRKILMNMDEFDSFLKDYDKYAVSSPTSAKESDTKYGSSFTVLDIPDDRIEMYHNKYDYMDGHDFEYFCASLLLKNGFQKVNVTQDSNDQGIDIIAIKDGVRYGIQCKCYSSDVGNRAVQEAFAGAKYYDCHVPVVLTNRYFTRSAQELAVKTNVLLWDRDKLDSYIENAK